MNIKTYTYRKILVDTGNKLYDLKGLGFSHLTPVSGFGVGRVELYFENDYLYGNFFIDTELHSRTNDEKQFIDDSYPSILEITQIKKEGNYIKKGWIKEIFLTGGVEDPLILKLKEQINDKQMQNNDEIRQMVTVISKLIRQIELI